MRLRKKAWVAGELESNPLIVQNPEDIKGKWSGLFGNCNPISLELGCGKGKFIAESALNDKNVNYIGLERSSKILAAAAKSARLSGAPNARLINADAERIAELFGREIKNIYIHFCDPWRNRKKWEKRRLTHRNFLTMYKNIMVPGGVLTFKTDNGPLFDFTVSELNETGWKILESSRDLYGERPESLDSQIKTEYEEKFIAAGAPIFMLKAAPE